MDSGLFPVEGTYLDSIDVVIDTIAGDDVDFSSDGNISNNAALLGNSEEEWASWLGGAESSPNDFERSPEWLLGRGGDGMEHVSGPSSSAIQSSALQSFPSGWTLDALATTDRGVVAPMHTEDTPTRTTLRDLFPQPQIRNSSPPETSQTTPPLKSGTRLDRDSVRILKKWLADHGSHPYADDTDKRVLQDQTGLSRTQIANWLANARRRGKMVSSSRAVSKPIDVPARPPTPAVNPLQRWVDSPPEHEPASASAIARAVASSSSLSRRHNSNSHVNPTQDGSERSLGHPSSATSVDVDSSCSSGGSFASATSHLSQNPFAPSLRPFSRPRTRRRKRGLPRTANQGKTSLATVRKTFQCTFCTETFGAKHDWHRHEHTLHLPLERWVCSPEGPCTERPSTSTSGARGGPLMCVFCGRVDPDDMHIAGHNYALCRDRSIHWRTFSRKDHLNQHLRLVHGARFSDGLMGGWKVAMPEVRSRCGFCDARLESWEDRLHHLAHHFKAGKTMADWKGGWGFEPHIELLVENSIPPYFIETERNSPFPFEGSRALAETPRSAYELIKLELAYFMQKHFSLHARMPTCAEMRLEACRILLASEAAYRLEDADDDDNDDDAASPNSSSWLQDIITADAAIFQVAKFGPMRSAAESRLFSIKVAGRNSLFERCPLEAQLEEFVVGGRARGGEVTVKGLREEACGIVARMEEGSTTPSEFIAKWLVGLMREEEGWLSGFVSRCGVEVVDELEKPDHSITAEEEAWPSESKQRHVLSGTDKTSTTPAATPSAVGAPSHSGGISSRTDQESILEARSVVMGAGSFFISDPNFYRWITEELARWVRGTMSPQNPNCHVPTDAEIQHYARWITYNDDDPLNQTIAENGDWLVTFKRDMGIGG